MENVSFEFLKSKRFISAASYVLSLVLVAYLPVFAGMELEIAGGLTIVFSILIGGYAFEDALQVVVVARAMAARTETKVDDQVVALAEALVNAFKSGVAVTPAQEINIGSPAVH